MTRRVWFARDAWFTSDPKVELLGEDHGPGGPLMLEEVLALAKLANDEGRVSARYAVLARRAFLDGSEQARAIVETCAEQGLLIVESSDTRGFTGLVPRWLTWQVSNLRNAERQAAARERNALRNGSVPPSVTPESAESNGPERYETLPDSVTTVVQKTVTENKDNSTVILANDDAAGEEDAAEWQVFHGWVEATGRSERTVFDPKRRRQVKTALKSYPLDELLDTVRGWRHDPHNRGENAQGKVYNDLGLLLRDAEHIEKFRDLERKDKGRSAPTGPYDDTAERLKRAYG